MSKKFHNLKMGIIAQLKNDIECGDYEAFDEWLNKALAQPEQVDVAMAYLADDLRDQVVHGTIPQVYEYEYEVSEEDNEEVPQILIEGAYEIVCYEIVYGSVDVTICQNEEEVVYYCVKLFTDADTGRDYIDINNEVVYLDTLQEYV